MPGEALFLLHWLALTLHMYQVPTYLLPCIPLALIGGIKEFKVNLYGSCHNRALYLCLCLPYIKDATAQAFSQSCFTSSCFIWMQCCFPCCYVKCSNSILQTHMEWANDTCLFASCDIHWSAKKAFSKDHCLTHEHLLLCSCIAEVFQCPAWTKLGELRLLCWDIEFYLMFLCPPLGVWLF